jgi:hypothetical protein
MNETQTTLYKRNIREELNYLTHKMLKEYPKTITHYGNIKSPTLILGLAPMKKHLLNSPSSRCFKFDIDLNQESKSGGVLIKVFKELNLDIRDFFFDNVYKVPLEMVENKELFHNLLEKEIDLLNPNKIICLGNDVYNIVKSLDVGVNIEIKKIWHPAFVLRGGVSFNNYLNKFRTLLVENDD